MKRRIVLIFSTLAVLLLAGCYKDVTSPGQDPSAPPQNVSFSGDLVPLFSANCTSAGCHDATPGHHPSLVPEKAYNEIVSGGFINTVVPHTSVLYSEVKSGGMPPNGALKQTDMQKILDWIRNGAPNN